MPEMHRIARRTFVPACLAAASLATVAGAGGPAATPRTLAPLEARAFALQVSSVGHWAYGLDSGLPGLELPRGAGHDLLFAGGLWASARAGGELRTAIAEFGSDFVPGTASAGLSSRDEARFRVFRVTSADTAGRAAWQAHAVPQGAPAEPPGDVTVWAAFTDAGPLDAEEPVHGARLTAPLTLEAGLTGWTYDRPGALADVAFLRWRFVNRGAAALDSLRLGLFLDPLGVAGSPAFVSSDTSRDLCYAWRQHDLDPVYGLEGPAVGIRVLAGPAVGGRALRPAACVAYPNGSDPADATQYDRVLRGLLPWGAAMLDSASGEPTRFWSPGDPVTALEWVATGPSHAHAVLALEPFSLAAGDSAELVAAVVTGRGADRFDSIRALRANADAAFAYWRDGFAAIPPREVLPLRAGPNPSRGAVTLTWSVSGAPKRIEVDVFDLAGRHVRQLLDRELLVGDHAATWDGRDDAGATLPQGVYVVRVRHGVRDGRVRVALLR